MLNYRVAHRYDEVTSLEENLHELKKEFWKKQQAQDHIAKLVVVC